MDPDETGWWALHVAVPTADVEVVSDALWTVGAAGIEERDGGTLVVLVAGFDDRDAVAAAARRLEADGRAAEVRPVVDDGLDAWRAHAGPVDAGRFVIAPAWQPAPVVAPDRTLLLLDPGRTFGSGSHPTTRLVLQAIAEVTSAGDRVLDVGCGSGVLAVAAALLGARATAIDVAPDAPGVTAENADRNGVGDRVAASARPLEAVVAEERRFDLVVANLLAPTIEELGALLVDATADTGRLVVSGLLADRWQATTGPLGLEVVDVAEEEGWVAVALERA